MAKAEMGHFIQAIVAPVSNANAIASRWSELPRLDCDNGFSIFPVVADLIDAKILPDKTPSNSDTLVLLTAGLYTLLQSMSHDGQLAYVETEYFGGIGGQGAVVFRNGKEVMPPTWSESGVINNALAQIGMEQGVFADRFEAAGFGLVRNNRDIIDLIDNHKSSNDA